MLASREAVKQKRQDSLDEQRGLEPKVDALVARTRELQKHVIIFLKCLVVLVRELHGHQ